MPRRPAMAKMLRAIGLMSGTSMDGIDVAMIDSDGAERVERGPAATYAYGEDVRARLRAGLSAAATLTGRQQRPPAMAALEAELTLLHAKAVQRFLQARKLAPATIDVIGFHGHTVLHAPE